MVCEIVVGEVNGDRLSRWAVVGAKEVVGDVASEGIPIEAIGAEQVKRVYRDEMGSLA